MPADEWQLLEINKYRGGLRILEVAPDCPFAQSGLQKDDILVGLDKWECISLDNFAWIINQIDQQLVSKKELKSWKVFIVRDNQTRTSDVTLTPKSNHSVPDASSR